MSQASSMSHVSSSKRATNGSAAPVPTNASPAAHAGLPNEQVRHAMKPSRWVLFLRTCFLYQLYRFVWINLRMIRMIWLSH